MDELCALEREEALRRAEYEARHAEALRRAESQSRHLKGVIDLHSQPRSQRLSKSATTSPIMRDGLTLTALNDPLGPRSESPPLSPATSGHPDSFRVKSKRRLSGPAWMLTPQDQSHHHPTIPQSRSSGHLVETMLHSPYHNNSWAQPYHQYRHSGEADRRGKQAYDEIPSPISSDGEQHLDRVESPKRIFHMHGATTSYSAEHSPPYYSSSMRTTTSVEAAYTPSTSPFLGPLRTLNIHSSNPSRAPSPVLLPPPATDRGHDSRDGIIPEDRMTPSRTSSVYGSPPSSGLYMRFSGKAPQAQQFSSKRPEAPFTFQNSTVPSSQVPTPALSSAPSSSGSSPGRAHIPSPTILTPQHRENCNVSGTVSASNSRPPSPHHPRGSPKSVHASKHLHSSSGNHNTHLAHSVRVAFGMTPIHSHPASRRSSPPPLPRNTSWSTMTGSYHQHAPYNFGQASLGLPGSRPGSRAPSPPIILPALKMAPDGVKIKDDDRMDIEANRRSSEKIELPHFSEFEAATRIPLSTAPGSKMSIDFVKS